MKRLAMSHTKQSHPTKGLFLLLLGSLVLSFVKELNPVCLSVKYIILQMTNSKESTKFSICWISLAKESG
ncbi:hypothetical protein Pint_03172 [Pistacia integerrima]|uniref:Uncharacterized protein n=1 Tax=Pistacia integerrima TaxID=434235 RepID=A0ACC0ZHP6_9ROSI|nr:hypothetical protein Pint_03172 [Pistacia integerrima]